MLAIILMVAMVSCKKDSASDNNGGNGGGGSDPTNVHEYVDLGLPSGNLWATCNIGATNPQDEGDLFAWGETETKNHYDWDNYKYCDNNGMIKYTDEDGLYLLEASDDAATVNWGGGWQTPSCDDFEELQAHTMCGLVYSTIGTKRMVFLRCIGFNGNYIELPVGFQSEEGYYLSYWYWSNTRHDNDCAYIYFIPAHIEQGFIFGTTLNQMGTQRYEGNHIRPILSPR